MRAMVLACYREPDVMHLRSTTPGASVSVINGESTYRGTGTRDLLLTARISDCRAARADTTTQQRLLATCFRSSLVQQLSEAPPQ